MLGDLPVRARRNLIYQHDGAPPHRQGHVVACLNQMFPNRWIGNNSPWRRWPARSPDLTPPDFWLFGYLKSLVHATPLPNDGGVELERRIFEACAAIPPEMVRRATSHVRIRLQQCINQQGGHVENWLT